MTVTVDTGTNYFEAAERCLKAAEDEQDPARAERLIEIAHAWISVARALQQNRI